jgi:hypothetical protein
VSCNRLPYGPACASEDWIPGSSIQVVRLVLLLGGTEWSVTRRGETLFIQAAVWSWTLRIDFPICGAQKAR